MDPSAAPSGSPTTLLDGLLEVAAVFIIPDWPALIALIPVGLGLAFIAFLAFTARKWATAGPTRRAPARVQPITPPHVHMPGGSLAPVMVAVGAFAVFLGLVAPAISPAYGGLGLGIGVTVLVVMLLAWGREAIRDFDQVEGARPLPAVVHPGPPPGVHMPGPSIRPFLGALGTGALFAGLVFGGWVLILAIVFLVYTLLGWLIDFTAEYRKVEEADHTGHLENIPARRLPARTLQVFAILFTLVSLWQLGIFPPTTPATAGGPDGSPGAPAPGAPVAPPGALELVAKTIAFDKNELTATADETFTIYLVNQDPPSTPHDVEIQSEDGSIIQAVPKTDGGQSQAYAYEPLAAGTYVFICTFHATVDAMKGTLTVE